MSVPVMSAGIRSGVNWMRLNDRCRMRATVLMRGGTRFILRICSRVAMEGEPWRLLESVEHLAHLASQGVRRERLLQEIVAGTQQAGCLYHLFGIARDEQHAQPRAHLNQLLRQ